MWTRARRRCRRPCFTGQASSARLAASTKAIRFSTPTRRSAAGASLPGCTLTLLDTPGHVDFSAEMERTLQVLDCAVLIISGPSGIQSHTVTLWRLLRRYQVPVILFFNKMDMETADRDALLAAVRAELDEGCIDFSQPQAQL